MHKINCMQSYSIEKISMSKSFKINLKIFLKLTPLIGLKFDLAVM